MRIQSGRRRQVPQLNSLAITKKNPDTDPNKTNKQTNQLTLIELFNWKFKVGEENLEPLSPFQQRQFRR